MDIMVDIEALSTAPNALIVSRRPPYPDTAYWRCRAVDACQATDATDGCPHRPAGEDSGCWCARRWLARLGQDEGWEQYTWLPWSSGGGVVVYADPQMLDGGPGRDLPPIQMAQVYVEAGSVRRVAMLRAWRRLACDKAGWARRSIVDLPVDLLRQIHAGSSACAESASAAATGSASWGRRSSTAMG